MPAVTLWRIGLLRLRAGIRTSNLTPSRPAAGETIALMITLTNLEVLVAGVLQEAVMFQRWTGTAESLLSPPLPASLVGTNITTNMLYLHYQAGMEQLRAILISALIAAYGLSNVGYARLRWAIVADAALISQIKPLLKVKRQLLTSEFLLGAWPTIELWLKQAEHLAFLNNFVETVDN